MGLTKKGKILLTSLATLIGLASIAAFAVSIGSSGPRFRTKELIFFIFREEASASASEAEVWHREAPGHQGLAEQGEGQDGGAGGHQWQWPGVGEKQERCGHFNVEYILFGGNKANCNVMQAPQGGGESSFKIFE